MSCESCIDEARERMRSLDQIKIKAKKYAKDNQLAIAICREGPTGDYFIAAAETAIRNQCIIIEIVSQL